MKALKKPIATKRLAIMRIYRALMVVLNQVILMGQNYRVRDPGTMMLCLSET